MLQRGGPEVQQAAQLPRQPAAGGRAAQYRTTSTLTERRENAASRTYFPSLSSAWDRLHIRRQLGWNRMLGTPITGLDLSIRLPGQHVLISTYCTG